LIEHGLHAALDIALQALGAIASALRIPIICERSIETTPTVSVKRVTVDSIHTRRIEIPRRCLGIPQIYRRRAYALEETAAVVAADSASMAAPSP
jgi:hypothetical protein